jgi:fermentation-respiration switch protein FrsA (DUF1100 family)
LLFFHGNAGNISHRLTSISLFHRLGLSVFIIVQYAVADAMYPMLPVSLFIPQDYDTLARLKELNVPLLVVHSQDDEIVPYRFGRSLYENYQGPKQFLEIGGSHNSGFASRTGVYMEGLSAFLQSLGDPGRP